MRLERNETIYKLREDEASKENVYNGFFEADSPIIYVVDGVDRLTGVITSGDFMRNMEEGRYVRKNCFAITLKDEQTAYVEAEKLFREHHITSVVPVLDETGKICYEIRVKREDDDKKFLQDFYEKLGRYEESRYLGEEIAALRELLHSQPIIVIGTQEQIQRTLGGLFRETGRISFLSKPCDAYGFMSRNTELLIDVSSTHYSGRNELYSIGNNGYSWRAFLDSVVPMVEQEYFSKFYRVTRNQTVTIADFLEKYTDRKIFISSRGVLAYALKEYLYENQFEIIESGGVIREKSFSYHYLGNGTEIKELLSGEQNLIEAADVMLQYFYLNREFSGQIPVLNFIFDSAVRMPQGGKKPIVRDK